MRRFVHVSAIAALASLPGVAFGQSKFEGVVNARLGLAQNAVDATYLVKGDQFRMDISGPGGMTMYMLHDRATDATLMVMPAQRMYMETSQLSGMGGQTAVDRKAPELKITGRKEMVAGYECEHVLITSDDGAQFDVCATRGIGSFVAMSNPMGMRGGGGGAGSLAWQRLGKDFFPLKVQRVGGDLAFEVTKIEKKPLDDGLFKVPEGFQKMDLGRMGRPPG